LAVNGCVVTFGTARRALGGLQHTRQRPVYQLHIIQCGTIITFALYRVKRL